MPKNQILIFSTLGFGLILKLLCNFGAILGEMTSLEVRVMC